MCAFWGVIHTEKTRRLLWTAYVICTYLFWTIKLLQFFLNNYIFFFINGSGLKHLNFSFKINSNINQVRFCKNSKLLKLKMGAEICGFVHTNIIRLWLRLSWLSFFFSVALSLIWFSIWCAYIHIRCWHMMQKFCLQNHNNRLA